MLNYSTWVTSFANMLVVSTTDLNFQSMLQNAIDDGEQRLYRELDLLDTVVVDTGGIFITGQRAVGLPATNGTFYDVNSIYAITPFGTPPNSGIRNALIPCSRDYLDFTYPSSAGSTVPQFFAMTTQSSIIVGPWPDQAYQMEVEGTIRPTPLGPTNLTTILTVYLPDVFLAATMVFGAAYLQNFGVTVDNPQMGVTWEMHLGKLLQSAQTEEARKKFTAEGWSSKIPSPIVTPPRT